MQMFGPWHPDVYGLSTGQGGDKLNCLPTLDGWGPFPGFAVASVAVGAAGGGEDAPALHFDDPDNSMYIGQVV